MLTDDNLREICEGILSNKSEKSYKILSLIVSKSLLENASIGHLMRIIERKSQLKVFAILFYRAKLSPGFFKPIADTFTKLNIYHERLLADPETTISPAPPKLKFVKFGFTPDTTVRNADYSKSERQFVYQFLTNFVAKNKHLKAFNIDLENNGMVLSDIQVIKSIIPLYVRNLKNKLYLIDINVDMEE